MATVVDQQPIFKHFCRICKKGFGCGRALGGHMRAHGIGEENGHIEDEDPACSDWDDKLTGGGNNNQPPGNKRMYALRTNPNRLKSCRICENCGKEFVSWKSFLEHGKCSSADANDSLVSSPTGSDYEDDGAGTTKRDYAWSKGKRTRRAKIMGTSISNCPSSEEEDLAHCLVLLSTARVDPLIADAEESCASASKDEEQRRNPVMNTLLPSINVRDKAKGVANKGLFECKACKKVFNSHQALGGHRASHKKVKGCFAANIDDLDDSIMDEDVITNDELTIFPKSTGILQLEQHPSRNQSQMAMAPKRKSKVHECSICHRIFSSGQALGGHKRCHWLTSNSPDTSSIARFHQFQDHQSQHFHQRSKLNKSEPLDLNLPAPVDDTTGRGRQDHENTLTFQVPTEIFLQPWIGVHANDENNDTITNNKKKSMINSSIQNDLDDEAESKVKLAKLSDLKDMNLGSGSSPWLQVGIGSTSNMGNAP